MDDYKIIPDKDDLRIEERERRRSEAKRMRDRYEALAELKKQFTVGLDLASAAVSMARAEVMASIEDVSKDKEMMDIMMNFIESAEKLLKYCAEGYFD